MDLSSGIFDSSLAKDVELANAQRRAFAPGVAPLQWAGTIILDDWPTMNVFKARIGIFKICEMFWIRDDSWLTIRKMNDMKFLKRFWLLEEKNWKYLQEIIDICNSKGVELYNTHMLAEVGFAYTEKEEESSIPAYNPVDIKEIMAPAAPEEEDNNANKWDVITKKIEQDMTPDMINLEELEWLSLSDIQILFKRVTGKWISPKFRNDKEWFVKQLTALKQ